MNFSNHNDLFIVTVGASAGGLEAIHEFFDNVPESAKLAFIIIQHLSSDYKSLLVELVSKHTHMQVQEAMHQEKVEAGYVYVIPNDKLLTIQDSKLMLTEKDSERGPNLSIDYFLYSLAKDQKQKAIAVILSGTGSDGTRGADAIKKNGGLVIVQDPETAKFDGMPRSLIATGLPDYILPPDSMPEEIYNYIDRNNGSNGMIENEDHEVISSILEAVHKNTNYDFKQYKPATIVRRINRRMLHTKQQFLKDYETLLLNNANEAILLAKEFFIGVTCFFRDKEAYDVLYNNVFPYIIDQKNESDVLKIWVTACSTGQEAYSIAMLLDRYLQTQKKIIEVKIFASDIDESSIEFASKARYSFAAVCNLEEQFLNTYFARQGNEYIVIPRIRKQIVFARHNILKDPPFIKNDFVSCRNFLIYLNPPLQHSVFNILNFSLNNGGYLFLGPSENPSPIKDEIEEVNSKWKIYKKRGEPTSFDKGRAMSNTFTGTNFSRNPVYKSKINVAAQLTEDFKKAMAEDLGYAAVYINENYEVKEVAGDFRRYLTLPDKILNLNILKMVATDIAGILSTAFRKVLKENKSTWVKNLRVSVNGQHRQLNVFVKPPEITTSQNYMLVIFGEVPDTMRPAIGVTDINLIEQNNYIQELEDELKDTRANLQMAVEGLETTNEELQSSNEELQTANEELQSSNEELQSLNEELHTLNTEHQLRIKELVELNDDLNNFFRSTEIAQIFLDANLRIRKFNPAAMAMVNIIENDIGRSFSNISNNIRGKEFFTDVEKCMRLNTTVEREVELENGHFCLMRILPYLRQDKKIDGVVITFIDISIIKNLNSVVNGVFNTSSNGIVVFETVRNNKNHIIDFKCTAANQTADLIFEKKEEGVVGQYLKASFASLTEKAFYSKCVDVVEKGKTIKTELALNTDEGVKWFYIVSNKLNDGLIVTLTDISQRKDDEEKLKRNLKELLLAKESLDELNTRLETKVKERTKDLELSEERFRLVASSTNDAIWDWDFAENKIWWSDSFYNLFGYDRSDPKVQSGSSKLEIIHPADRQRINDEINKIITSDNASDWHASYKIKKSDGSDAIIIDKGTLIRDELGKPYRMLGALVDVTQTNEAAIKLKTKNDELQNLIQEFKFVTDFMPQMVWSTQPNGYHDFYNKGWYDFTGLDFEQTKNKGWANVLHPDDYERTWKSWEYSLRTGKPYEIEYRMRRYDGEYRWFLARAVPLRDANKKIIKWFGTCTDIHDQKAETDILEQKVFERTEELQRINVELETSNNELMQFASVASHDLQEPLRKIHIFSNMIKERYFHDSASGAVDYLNRIIKSSSRATKLINDLLSFSRLSGESLFKRTDLNEIIREVLGDIELAVTDKNAKIEIDSMPVIEAVPGQMRQIFQNMISNALKFTKEDVTPQIRVEAQKIESLDFAGAIHDGGNYLRISIKDNGIGFDPSYANKIFTIFQRLHPREKYEGTGIGLAIAKKIIEKHNGIITAKSSEGEGAEFIIVLPLVQPNQNN